MQKITLESIESCIVSPTYYKAMDLHNDHYPEVRCDFELSLHRKNDVLMNPSLVVQMKNNAWADPNTEVGFKNLTAIAEFSREDALYLRNYLDAFLEATK